MRIFCNCCWNIEKIMPQNYKLNGKHCIKIKEADDPSNIKWENVKIDFPQVSYFKTALINYSGGNFDTKINF